MLPALAQTSAFRDAIPSSSAVLSSSTSDSLSLAAENLKSLLLHISSIHHSVMISHHKVPALIQPIFLASLDIFLVFPLLDSLFFSWLPPPVLFPAHCQKHVGEEATSESPIPCGSLNFSRPLVGQCVPASLKTRPLWLAASSLLRMPSTWKEGHPS